ncbi:MAG TPA: cytochrome c [Acidimicrobiia bacterium]
MGYEHSHDAELDASTNRVMAWGVGLLAAMVLAFPLYRFVEPSAREEARELQLQSLQEQGAHLYEQNCSSCHGLDGEGGLGPAINSQQYLQAASDEQTRLIVAVGVPGTGMSAWSLDYGGPLTSEQIKALSAFIHSWEETAPDLPNWRTPLEG